MSGASFNLNGANAIAPVINQVGGNLNIGVAATGAARFNLWGSTNLIGNTAPAHTLVVMGDPWRGSATLTAATGFTNAGVIVLTESDFTNGVGSTLNVNGELVNTGTINSIPNNLGVAGNRTIFASLDNRGTVNVNTNLTLNKGLAVYTNTGTFNIAAGKNLSVMGTTPTFNQNAGTLLVAGTYQHNSGTFKYAGGAIDGGGTFQLVSSSFFGAGTIQANVMLNNSQLNPGLSPGVLNISGNYTQDSNSRLNVEIGGHDPGTGHDQLNISGIASLAGTIHLSLIDNFLPDYCEQFTFLTYRSKSGDFAVKIGLDVDLGGRYLRRLVTATSQKAISYVNSPKVNIFPTTVSVAEGGTTGAYNACLASAPAAEVMVTPAPNSQVSVSPATLVFSLANWEDVQTVTVSAIDDTVTEGDHLGLVLHSSTSGDNNYNILSLPSVNVLIQDNDTNPASPPVAVGDSYSVPEDGALSVPAPGVLGNDTDSNGDTLTAILVAGPSQGTLSLSSNGSFNYVPDANYNGGDSFTYRANDGSDNSDVATVSIVVRPVNDAPVVSNDAYGTDEDNAISVAAPGVLTNDSDVDGDTLSAVLLAPGPSHGVVTLNSDGSFVYESNANWNGVDSFQYKVTDGFIETGPATVVVAVNAVNDAPEAAGDSYSVNEDTTLNVATPGVLGNDSDAEDSGLTAILVAGPAHGTLTLNPSGSLSYVPEADFNGTDVFTYKATDGFSESNPTSVIVTVRAVNDAPVAFDGIATVDEDSAVAIALVATDAEGAALIYSIITPPAHGTLSGSGADLTYLPDSNFNGPDSFTFKASDGNADSSIATLSITVSPVNDAPTGTGDTYSVDEDNTLNVTPGGVLSNDSDVESASLAAILVSGPVYGTLTLNPNGSFTYLPGANYNGSDSFVYKASDGALDSDVTTVNITVRAVNDAPTASAGQDQTVDALAMVTLSGEASDVDGQTLNVTWTQIAGPPVLLNDSGTLMPSFIAPQVSEDIVLAFLLTVSDGMASVSSSVNVTVRDATPGYSEAARTIGYWRNHPEHLAAMLRYGAMDLGDTSVATVEEAVLVLRNSSATDARDALRAQLLATMLNLRNGADPSATGDDIRATASAARQFLAAHNTPVTRRHPDREWAIALKDRLDVFNNSGEQI